MKITVELRKMSQLDIRNLVIDKWRQNTSRSQHLIAKELKMPRSTVNSIIKRFNDSLTTARKKKESNFEGPYKPNLDSKIIQTIKANRSMSIRDIGKKHKTSKSMVERGKKRNGLKTYKKQKIPKVSEKQAGVIKTRARKLYDHLRAGNHHLILDDETYIKADFSTIAGAQYYNKFEGETLPQHQTTIGQEKYGSKFMIWQAICECGMRSQAYVVTGTLDHKLYIKECLKKRLLPFIRKHDVPTLFWPDLASCHYAKTTLEFMTVNNIAFVPKNMNPPNVPQCRPIERYWALVKNKLRMTGQTVTDEKQFLKMYNKESRKVKKDTVADLMKGISSKLRAEWTKQ